MLTNLTNPETLKTMDTPMLRDLYRAVRQNCLELCGGTKEQFDRKVLAEFVTDPKPSAREIVIVALTFEEQCIADWEIQKELEEPCFSGIGSKTKKSTLQAD